MTDTIICAPMRIEARAIRRGLRTSPDPPQVLRSGAQMSSESVSIASLASPAPASRPCGLGMVSVMRCLRKCGP